VHRANSDHEPKLSQSYLPVVYCVYRSSYQLIVIFYYLSS